MTRTAGDFPEDPGRSPEPNHRHAEEPMKHLFLLSDNQFDLILKELTENLSDL